MACNIYVGFGQHIRNHRHTKYYMQPRGQSSKKRGGVVGGWKKKRQQKSEKS